MIKKSMSHIILFMLITSLIHPQNILEPFDNNSSSLYTDFEPGIETTTAFKRRVYELEYYNIKTPALEYNTQDSDRRLHELAYRLGVSDDVENMSIKDLRDKEQLLTQEEKEQKEVTEKAEEKVQENSEQYMDIKKEML